MLPGTMAGDELCALAEETPELRDKTGEIDAFYVWRNLLGALE
jgi:hypothetical protein